MNILVVDDMEDSAVTLAELLAQFGHDSRHHRLDGGLVGYIGLAEQRTPAQRFDLLPGCLGGFGQGEIVERDIRAILGQRDRGRPANSRASARHQRNLPLKRAHGLGV